MTTTYVLPVYDENGLQVDVALAAGVDGYELAPVYDETGTAWHIDSVPAEAPPVGEFPVYDEVDGQFLIPFAGGDVVGLYERTSNTIRAMLDEELTQNFGLTVLWDNVTADTPAITTPSAALWAEATLDFFGEELIGIGAGANRYRLPGEVRIVLRYSTQRGDEDPISYVGDIKTRLRDWTSGGVTIDDPYHTTRERDGAWWRIDIVAPFRSDDSIDRPTPMSSGATDAGTLHDTIRTLFNTLVSTPLSLTTLWDNAAVPTVIGSPWCRVSVLTATAATAGSGRLRPRRQVGILKSLVAGPTGVGDRDVLRIVDEIATAFRGRSSGGVRFQVPSVSKLGRQGASWVYVVDVPFTADEVV